MLTATACPKCGADLQADAVECPSCGVVLAKARSRPSTAAELEAQAPAEKLFAAATAAPVISLETIEALQRARPWVRFFVIYGYTILTIVLLGGLALLLDAADKPKLAPLAVIYLLYACLGFAVVAPLGKSAADLRRLGDAPADGLQSFAINNAAFWRRAGIITLVLFLIVAVSVIAVVVLGAASLLR